MYAGTTFRGSGRVGGVHQKLDRIARRHITKYVDGSIRFPAIAEILQFEGVNGPDGNKRKSPFRDAQWHFINPDDDNDRDLLVLIDDHIYNLTESLKDKNHERSAFEAAWLAHAVVDGLTPAHHYPLENKIEELWGKPQNERKTVFERNFITGKVNLELLLKNWQYWGAKGAFTAHVAFEWGVASVIVGHRFRDSTLKPVDLRRVEKDGFEAIFMESLHKIASLNMYDEFGNDGWTIELANQTRKILIPEIIKAVSLAWYYAAYLAKVK